MYTFFVRAGFNRTFLLNPVTWVIVGLTAVSLYSVERADRYYDYTCAVISPLVTSAVTHEEYFAQRLENITYEHCLGRIPERYADRWPLTDCRPGGRPHFSNGSSAAFPQKCRFNTGTYQVW